MSVVTVAQSLAEFVVRASWEMLTPGAQDTLKLHLLDAVGCAVAAVDAAPMAAVRALVDDSGGKATCSLVGGGRTALDRAAFHNAALVRYLDFNDAYLAPGETCHPSDNMLAVLAAAQAAGASGKALLTALAVSYQVQCRLSDAAPLRDRGFDHTTQGTCAAAAGVARALGIDVDGTANALAIAATISPALRVTRTGSLSHWKGLASAYAAMAGAQCALLAQRGITGPPAAFEGVEGFMDMVGRPFDIDWSAEGLDVVGRTALKRFNAEVHSQSAIEAALELVQDNRLEPSHVSAVSCEIFDVAFDIIGGGREGTKTDIHTKEQADHSLPYLLAVSVLDGRVMPEQFAPERIERADVQRLLRRVLVRPDPALSPSFPNEMPCRVHIRDESGRVFVTEKRDYLGFPTRPMSWSDVRAKFRELTKGRLTEAAQQRIESCVAELDTGTAEALCALLEGAPQKTQTGEDQ